MTEAASKKSDLPARTASAVVMLAVAGTALWSGGWTWNLLVLAISAGVLWEFARLVVAFEQRAAMRLVWLTFGLIYVGLAGFTLLLLRSPFYGMGPVLMVVAAVIGVDVGAYFAGRTIGGPKIAPKISPSKTWSGLGGGMLGATLVMGAAVALLQLDWSASLRGLLLAGPVVAIIAQAGDFFESWLKRRAGVKDSSHLIPGHGGLFDRVDGLLAVCFTIGVLMLGTVLLTLARGESLLPSPA